MTPRVVGLLLVGTTVRNSPRTTEGLPPGASLQADGSGPCWPESRQPARSWLRELGTRVLIPEAPCAIEFGAYVRCVGEPGTHLVRVVVRGPAADGGVVFDGDPWSLDIGPVGVLRPDLAAGQSIGTSSRIVPVRFAVPAEGLYEVSAEVTGAEGQSTPLFVTVGRGGVGSGDTFVVRSG